MSIQFVPVCAANRERVNDFIQERWLSLRMIVRGRAVDMSGIDGVAAVEDGRLVGLVTYIIADETLEIMSLDSVEEGRGTGTALIKHAVAAAREKGCARVALITTNDNVKALRFYRETGLRYGAAVSRRAGGFEKIEAGNSSYWHGWNSVAA